jgi:two-component system sensor histidine kinase DesK
MFPKKYGFFPYIWLIYIIMPIINIQSESGIKLIIGYLMIGLFVLCYRQLYCATGRRFFFWLGLQMLTILIMSLFYNFYNLYMGFFTANSIGWFTDKKRFKISMAAFAVVELIPILLLMKQFPIKDMLFSIPFFLIMLVSPFGIRSMNRRQQLEKELDQAKERIKELVKREERVRIARDLHDTLGHTLSLITLKSQLVEKLAVKDPQRAQKEAKEIYQTSRAALRQVRELVSDMRAITVTEELAETSEILRVAGIRMDIEGEAELEDVAPLTQNILSLCIKEAITNIVKHSQATLCRISIGMTERMIMIRIEDNGIGPEQQGTIRYGNGLNGMKERLSLIEGSLTISSGDKQGTSTVITVPQIIKEREDGETA